jgi:hypothetical protein
MTARSIRRAQERKANKLARKAASLEASQPANQHTTAVAAAPEEIVFDESQELSFDSEPIIEAAPLSPARLAANQANAQLSSGPKTAAGKAKASLNAVKSALTGRTVLLPIDDAGAYQRHLLAYEKELRPFSQQERTLVQSLADIAWRLNRIPALELAIYAKGHVEFANLFDGHEPSSRPGLIELHTFLTYEKQLRNLQLQESRLARRREKEYAELRRLQQERNQKEKQELEMAAKLYLAAKHDRKPFDPADHGFEFSNQDVEEFLEGVRAANIANSVLRKDRAEAKAA